MQVAIELTDLGHGFRVDNQDIELFRDISARIEPNQTTSIVGASGSGKSTLLAIMGGLEQPKMGQIRYVGEHQSPPVTIDTVTMRKHAGFVFQNFHLLDELDAVTNVALPLRLKGDKHALEKAHHWLEQVGLAHRAKQAISRLSGGEQQRVAIARALIAEPAFVFADEPTGSLDEATAHDVTQVMYDCCEANGAGLVMVTHNPELAARAQHAYCLTHGKLEQTK